MCARQLITLALTLVAGASSFAMIDSPRVTSDRWPSGYSIADFANDAIRLEQARTDEDKFKALFLWNQRVMRHGYGYSEGPSVQAITDSWKLDTTDQWRFAVIDPAKLLFVYGEGWCDTRSRLFHALCWGAGLKSETVSIFDPKVRVWYADADGVARWHLCDPFRSWYVYTRDGSRIASYEDILADPSLITNPSRTSIPYAYTTETNFTSMFMEGGAIFPQNAHTSFKLLPREYHGLDIALRRGEALQLNWSAAGKYYPIYELMGQAHRCPNGPHSHIFFGPGTEHTTFASGAEVVIDPANWPYVKNYYRPCDNAACPFHNKPVKWYGNGTLTYAPDLSRLERYRDGLYSWGAYRNIAETGGVDGAPNVRPAQANAEAWMTFVVRTPYVIADAMLEAEVMCGSAGDVCTLSISADKGDTWREVWRGETVGATNVGVNIGMEPWRRRESSVTGQYEYLVKVGLKAADPARTGVNRLRLTSDVQFNMFTLPMLQPGENRVRFGVGASDAGETLQATLAWDDRGGTNRTCVQSVTQGHRDVVIRTDADKPDDITMRYLRLENRP